MIKRPEYSCCSAFLPANEFHSSAFQCNRHVNKVLQTFKALILKPGILVAMEKVLAECAILHKP